MSGIKITLDNSALDRLLGGQTEVEVELRNVIVQEFAKKHLKGLVNDATLQALLNTEFDKIRPEINKQIAATVGQNVMGWGNNITLRPEFLEKIAQSVGAVADMAVAKAVGDARNSIEQRINERIEALIAGLDHRLESLTQEVIDQRVKARIAEVMAAA